MSNPYRVAILGLGHWYSAYNLARALRESPRAELVAVAWHRPEQLGEFISAFSVRGYAGYEELLAREDVDAVHLAPPVAEMADCAILAAKAGRHFILGKPMAMTLAEADRMIEAVDASGVHCVAFQGIKRLAAAALKARLDAGEIGEIRVMHQTARWSIAEDWYRSGRPGWFADPGQVPGGAFIDEGIYWIDMLRWLAGSEIVQVEARMGNLVHRDIGVEDWGLATFGFANGITATLEGAWTINSPRATGPSPKQNAVLRTEIIGTRGEIIEDGLHSPGRAVLAAGAQNWVFERDAPEPYGPPSLFPLSHLLDCIEHNRPSPASLREARASLRVALAAYEAARSGTAVRM